MVNCLFASRLDHNQEIKLQKKKKNTLTAYRSGMTWGWKISLTHLLTFESAKLHQFFDRKHQKRKILNIHNFVHVTITYSRLLLLKKVFDWNKSETYFKYKINLYSKCIY